MYDARCKPVSRLFVVGPSSRHSVYHRLRLLDLAFLWLFDLGFRADVSLLMYMYKVITLLHLIVGPLSPRLPVISNQYRFQSELNPD